MCGVEFKFECKNCLEFLDECNYCRKELKERRILCGVSETKHFCSDKCALKSEFIITRRYKLK